MQKLLQINVTANWGSTGKIAEQIGVAVTKAGWESYIAYGRWSNSSQSHLIKIGGRWNKYLHYIEQFFLDNEGLCSRWATRQLIRRIKELKPDIVQLHNIHDHYLNYRLLFVYLNQTDIRVVWTFHDCWAFTGHCFHFETKHCMKWKTICHDCPMRNVLPKTVIDRSPKNYRLKKDLFVANKNLTIVACSDWMAGLVKESFLKGKKVSVIKNGIDIDTFMPVKYPEQINIAKSDARVNILAVSSVWNADKGLSDIYLLRKMLSREYVITIVGLTERQINELPPGIVGIQRTQNVQDLVQFYSDAAVFINPTYADTFPTVNLEALACGTPVITYRTCGSPEAVDAATGLIVKQGDIAAMAAAIQRIRGLSAQERAEMSMACRRRAEDLFDKDKCFEMYVKLYNYLLK